MTALVKSVGYVLVSLSFGVVLHAGKALDIQGTLGSGLPFPISDPYIPYSPPIFIFLDHPADC